MQGEYIAALRRADVVLGELTDRDDGIVTLGNGDVQAVVSREGEGIVVRLAKHDVWDRRMDTSEDVPLLSVEELTAKVMAEGDAFGDEMRRWLSHYPSYERHPYPCPVLCAKVCIAAPVTTTESHRLSLCDGALYSHLAGGCLRMRVDANCNCLVIDTLDSGQEVSLVPSALAEMDAPETGERDGTQYILQTLPGDGDVPAWHFAVALRRCGTAVFVSVATSKDRQGCFEEALSCVLEGDCFVPRNDTPREPSLWDNHLRWWREFWSASGIALEDHFLEGYWYRSLYLLACVCRPGKAVPGLYAGIHKEAAPWHGAYTWDYNMEMTFWGCYAANHPEMGEPYDTEVLRLLKRAQWLAKTLYNVDGAFYPIWSAFDEPEDPATCTANNHRMSLQNNWGRMLGTTGFVIQNLWRHYLFTQERTLLERIYPALYHVAMFYVNYGKLFPSNSPEHWGFTPHFQYNTNGAYDICMARYALAAAAEASEILDVHHDERARWRHYADTLPDYPTHGTGDTAIFTDMENAPPISYNIPVPLLPVFPGEDIAFATAHREQYVRTMDAMRFDFYDAVTLGMVAMRLGLPDALERFRAILKRTATKNGYASVLPEYHPFNNFNSGLASQAAGMLAPLCEMLLQSHGNVIRLFPAYGRKPPSVAAWDWLPTAFRHTASFSSLRAQGAFLVSSSIDRHVVGDTTIASLAGLPCRILNAWQAPAVTEADTPVPYLLEDGILSFPTSPGKRYRICEGA